MTEIFEAIEKSFNDKRSYRTITLSNKIEVVLVSDPETEKSAAACDVKVGAMSDPKEAQGLAHFLEHMLFMGTEKYPEENGYSAYLNAHGGSSNAYTAQEDTVYYFDVQNDFFQGALDMFASFFSCPLFNESSTFREMNAVDNENTKNLQSDNWREFQLMKELAKEDHPFHSFSTGNLETLKNSPEKAGINIRELLLDFYRKHYSANVMKVAVYGKDSLDTLQSWVEDFFGSIENRELSVPEFPSDPYGPEQLSKVVEVAPVRDSKGVSITFNLPPVESLYLAKPTNYLAHLIGHEGGGSILSLLKAKGWANGLSAFTSESYRNFASFAVNVELTDNGVEHVNDVVTCVFEYIGMLRSEGPKEWISEEVRDIAEMNFRFINKMEPSNYVTRICSNMHVYRKEHVLSGEYLIIDAQQTLSLSSQYLQYLSPSNSIILIKHRGIQGKTTLNEPWYGTPYNARKFTADELAAWERAANGNMSSEHQGKLVLPERNPFLATDFTLKGEVEGVENRTAPALLENAVVAFVVESNEVGNVTPDVAEKGEGEAEGEEEEEQEEETDDGDGGSGAGGDVVKHRALPGRLRMTWFKQDLKWNVPKSDVFIKLETIQAYISPLHVALTEVYAKILKEKLNEFSYYADCAGLYYNIENTRLGFELQFYGYNHKQSILVAKTLEEMSLLATTGDAIPIELFDRIKQKILRSYYNFMFSAPYYHSIMGTLGCLEEPRWSPAEKYASLKSATIVDMRNHCSILFRQIRAEVLVMGNVTQTEALTISALTEQWLKADALPHSQEPIRRAVALVPGIEYIYRQQSSDFNPKELNSAIENVYMICEEAGAQSKAGDVEAEKGDAEAVMEAGEEEGVSRWGYLGEESLLQLLSHLMSEPLFDQLRTKEQLGYITQNGVTKFANVLALRILVQSNNADPVVLNERIESFLVQYRTVLAEMTVETLQTNIQAVVEKLLEKAKNIDQEASRIWQEISNSTYLFSRRQMMSEFLKTTTLTDLVDFYDLHISASSPVRRMFSSQFFGAGKPYPSTTPGGSRKKRVVLVRDPSIFKSGLSLLPAKNYVDNIDVEEELVQA